MFKSTTDEFESPYVSWTKELSIGHALIDADHQHLFDIANRLQAEIQKGPDPEADAEYSIVGEVLVELIEHTGGHFKREEAVMQVIRFPGYEKHRLEHTALMNKVDSLHRRFMQEHSNVSLDVAEFLRKSLIPHIMTSDMELGRGIQAVK